LAEVTTTAAALVSSATATVATCTSVPDTYLTTQTYDFVRADGASEPRAIDQTASIVAGICIVVWKTIANVGDVLLGLSFVEVPSEHMFEVVEVFSTHLTVIWHLYHSVHQVSG
jgi:hypothetical protein